MKYVYSIVLLVSVEPVVIKTDPIANIPITQTQLIIPGSGSQSFTHLQAQQKAQPAIGRSRPQSFAQKLRSTGKTVKGKLG